MVDPFPLEGWSALQPLRAISLFSGVGGCAFGFREAGISLIDAADIDSDAVQGFNHNIAPVARVEDLARLSGSELLERNRLRSGELDVFLGGPPCQGFSSAGAKFWEDPRNTLLRHYTRLLAEVRPRWFLLENVEGMLTSGNGSYIYELSKRLVDLGYTFRLKKLYCHNYGLPQLRKRVFLLGNAVGLDFDFPTEGYVGTGSLRDGSHGVSVRTALDDLRLGSTIREDWPTWHTWPRSTTLNLQRIRLLKQGQNMRDLPEELQHASYLNRANRRVSDGIPTERRGGAPAGMRRLVEGHPSPTITSAAIREFIHYEEDRFITVREAARLQSFPDDFEFFGKEGSVIQQIGNAIPPIIARLLAEQIIAAEAAAVRAPHSGLLSFELTKSGGVSPALANTATRLADLQQNLFTYA